MQLKLTSVLEPWRAQLEATQRAFIRVKPAPEKNAKPWESKIGGSPYMPKGAVWPTGPEGAPLFFLAQINFAQLPADAPDYFPRKGIVQFFIADDDLYGMDFDDGENQDTFRVVYYADVTENASTLETKSPSTDDYGYLPHHPEASHPLGFVMENEFCPMTDYQFWQTFGAGFFQQFGEQEWSIQEQYGKDVRSDGHKIDGYAYFTQDDPRRAEDPMILLLQIDSDEMMDLMWGDMGVGHFFIREKDLRAGDFSKVLYDWDGL